MSFIKYFGFPFAAHSVFAISLLFRKATNNLFIAVELSQPKGQIYNKFKCWITYRCCPHWLVGHFNNLATNHSFGDGCGADAMPVPLPASKNQFNCICRMTKTKFTIESDQILNRRKWCAKPPLMCDGGKAFDGIQNNLRRDLIWHSEPARFIMWIINCRAEEAFSRCARGVGVRERENRKSF